MLAPLGGAMLVAGCAQTPELPLPEVPLAQTSATVGTALYGDAAQGRWLDGRLSVEDPRGWLTYDAQYQVDGGDLLPRLTDDSLAPLTAAPGQLAGEAFRQSVRTQLPALAGTRPVLSFDSVASTQWNLAGEARRDEQKAQLVWSPAPVDLQLQWSAPRAVSDPNAPLDCSLRGSMQLGLGPLGMRDQSLLLGARDCSVDAPGRATEGLGVQSWTGAWQFGDPAIRNKLALTRLATLPEQAAHGAAIGAGYEVKLSQARTRGRWIGDSALGLRHVDDAQGLPITEWTAQASIERRIHQLRLTAGWQRDADPLWFVPAVARPVDQLAVGLDVKPWLAQTLGLPRLLDASLSYRWNESSDPALDGGGVYWNLSKAW